MAAFIFEIYEKLPCIDQYYRESCDVPLNICKIHISQSHRAIHDLV